jgi:hypothetical protein
MKQLTVRSGKGDKDRFTTFPASLTPFIQNHLEGVRALHERDLANGHGEVYPTFVKIVVAFSRLPCV